MYDFANILFSGVCNARCPFCIGRQIDPRLIPPNLDRYPPRGLDRLIELVHLHGIRQVVLSGANTDPQAYRHEARLLDLLRDRLPPGTALSLHTNARLALRKLELLNRYDRVCLSIPSFEPSTYRRMMGVAGPPDLGAILERARLPVKVSCILLDDNRPEMPAFLNRLHDLGVRRAVLRKPYGERRPWKALLDFESLEMKRAAVYRGSPVMDYRGMEVTLWDFEGAQSASLNLFSSGLISAAYRLVEAGGAHTPAALNTSATSRRASS